MKINAKAKKIDRLAMALLLAVCMVFPFYGISAKADIYGETLTFGDEEIYGNIKYEPAHYSYNGTEYTMAAVTGVVSPVKDLVLPEKIGDYYVCLISDSAFEGDTVLETMTLPSGMANIGNAAFKGCTSLKSVDFTENVLSYIGKECFRDCTSLQSFTMSDKLLDTGDAAFKGCTSLKSVKLSNNLYTMSDGMFYGCTSLTSVTIPESVHEMVRDVFNGCTSLKNIEFKGRPSSIGYTCFYNTPWLDEYEGDFLMIQDLLVAYKGTAKDVVIPSDVREIGIEAFKGSKSLESVVVPDSVKTICSGAFEDCTALKDVKLGSGVTTLFTAVFQDCDSLESIYIPDNVSKVMTCCFYSCDNLKDVRLSRNIETIEEGVFGECRSLTSIFLPESVSVIAYRGFQNCTALESLIVEGCVTFQQGAFRGASKFVIYCRENSKMEELCKKYGLAYDYYVPEEPEELGIIGDVNGSGTVELDDALAILRHSAEIDLLPAEYEVLGDVNGDGVIDASDAIAIMRYAVELPSASAIGTVLTK